MENIKKVRLLFEQSGTFKKVFQELGYEAYDYDLDNQFGQTDYQIDLFKEIDACFVGYPSNIFNTFDRNDLLIAFFPCIRFSSKFALTRRSEAAQFVNDDLHTKAMRCLDSNDDIHRFLTLLTRLVLICDERHLRLIIENPYHCSYLLSYWFAKPSVIDLNRRLHGDYYRKPTMYYFFGCEPENNLLFGDMACKSGFKREEYTNGIERSLISPVYVWWWVVSFVLTPEQVVRLYQEHGLSLGENPYALFQSLGGVL